MIRRISYNWLKEYIGLKVSAQQFASEFSLKSMSIERTEKVEPVFKKVVTAKITDIKPHPNADRLRLVTVDYGQGKQTVVCGAPNIAVGNVIAFAFEGATLLNPDNLSQTTVLKSVDIRGVDSAGMVCGLDELGFGTEHYAVLTLPENTPLGKPLETLLVPSDQLFDIEITSNRPDAMSVVGLVQEAAAVFSLKAKLKPPAKPKLKAKKLSLTVKVTQPKLCPRYQAVVMAGVRVDFSPLWLQLRLMQAGIRPINNIVDITNYVLLEYGQPMHVFDYQKITDKKIVVRLAKPGEKILALDGKTYQLESQMLVIADAAKPIAIAGVMGGQDSAASNQTSTIVFEAANFNSVSVRKTARALNLHSESSDLFEKGLPKLLTTAAIDRAVELAQDLTGAKVASLVLDSSPAQPKVTKINFSLATLDRYLGITIPAVQVKKILTNLGFKITGTKTWQITRPWWRNDIEGEHDIVEEVARIYGYHNLPTQLPTGQMPVRPKDLELVWEDKAKDVLSGLGFTEVYNYSMVSEWLLKQSGINSDQALKIANPLSEDMEYLRPVLFPQMLQNIASNINNFSELRLFELSKTYVPNKSNDLPTEVPKLVGAMVLDHDVFSAAKGTAEFLLKKMGIKNYQFSEIDSQVKFWQPGSALNIMVGNDLLGHVGLMNSNLTSKFSIINSVAFFTFDFATLAKYASPVQAYQSIPQFPAVQRDLAIVVSQNLSWRQVEALVTAADGLVESVVYLSTFINQSIGPDKKSLAFRLTFRASDRTLKSEEVDLVVKKIVDKLKTSFGASLR